MQKKSIDHTLAFLVLGLVIFGMIMISSVSVYSSFKITSLQVSRGDLEEAHNYFYLLRNMLHVGISIAALVIFSKIPYSFYEKNAKNIFFSCLFLLFIVLFIGTKLNGARGWIDIPGVPFSLQPVEFMKIGLILFLASYMKRFRMKMGEFEEGFLPFFGIVGMVFLLLIFQPDFGSILIIAPVAISLYFIGGGNIRYIGVSLLVCVVGAGAVYSIGKLSGEEGNGNSLSYISQRIDNFVRDSKAIIEKSNPDGKDYQIKQGLIAIGSAGFFGLGFGKSVQKWGYLPEVQGDFIFSVITEELGFLGAFVLLLLYLFIAHRGFTIARSVKDPFGQYVASGITILIIVQACINIGVNLNVVPLTGVTLPFISYGGSSILSLMVAVGILLSISRHMEYKPQNLSDILQAKRRIRV
ncbi:cell division protein FtsW [Candidatus Gracilibacteria bacterium]|nr:cell division protein FtsW [Candidatus Gracilibacteria bacterium]